jgi:hypothetical protein
MPKKEQTISAAKILMKKNIKWIKTRRREAETEVKQQLLINYGRSLIIFFGTP